MNPFTAIYSGATGLRNSLYDRGILQSRSLRCPVISVGNLSVGGSGKTPFVIALGELLQSRGIMLDVLTRGYRRKSRGIIKVDPSGTSERYGDEPLLIARKLNCPVIVGASRYHAGSWAEQHFNPLRSRVHLLDDGFQHRRLARDFDIVLVTPEDLSDSVVPAGRLREALPALRRADAVVLSEGMKSTDLPAWVKNIWYVRRRLSLPAISVPAIAFAGIARPQRFFDELRKAGVELKDQISFRDHYRYHASDVRHLLRLRQRKGAATFITTEKDAINLGTHLSALEPIVVPMKMEFVTPEEEVFTALWKALGRCSGASSA